MIMPVTRVAIYLDLKIVSHIIEFVFEACTGYKKDFHYFYIQLLMRMHVVQLSQLTSRCPALFQDVLHKSEVERFGE